LPPAMQKFPYRSRSVGKWSYSVRALVRRKHDPVGGMPSAELFDGPSILRFARKMPRDRLGAKILLFGQRNFPASKIVLVLKW